MILGIDLGSTVFKAELLDDRFVRLSHGHTEVFYTSPATDRVEMPIPQTEEAFRKVIADTLKGAGVSASDLRAVAITSQAQTFTIRTRDGNARIPFISWRDRRCQTDHRAASALTDFAAHGSVYEPGPLLMLAKLAHLQNEFPGRLVRADDLVLMLPTWFVMQLTGKAVVDTNLAAMSGLYSLQHGDWWNSARQFCAIQVSNLPAHTKLGAVAGQTTRSAERYGLAAGIPVVLAGNDQTAGAYDAGIHQHDAVLITLGTAQVAYLACERLPAPTPAVIRGPYPRGLGYQLVADEHGAGTVHWACTVLGRCSSEAAFDAAAAEAKTDCGGVRFVADGPAGSGRWIGVTSQTTEADQARAVLVCLVERLAGMLERLERSVAEKQLWVAGGGSNSDIWLECLQEQLGQTLTRTEGVSPARGAVRMAWETRHGRFHR